MNDITLAQASKLTSPNPVCLICTPRPDGTTNLATVSWWTYLSFHPETIGFAMSGKSYSGELCRATGKVVLTVPGEELAEKVMKCGSCSGRNVDKAAELNVELVSLPGSDIRVPAHSRVALVCTLEKAVEAGDHVFHVCHVEKAYGDEAERALFAWDGYSRVQTVD